MHRTVVIANPIASQFTGGTHRDVMSILSRDREVEALWPASPAEAETIAAEAVAGGARVVVAMGGDGMVHHVAQGLVGTGAALGIIPVGTTNVVARLVGVPSRPTKAARLIARSGPPAPIGVARLQLDRGSTTTIHHAVFAAGFGLDAEVVVEADRDPYRKYRFGSIHYARTAFRIGLGRFPARRPHVTVTAGEHRMEASTILIQIREVFTYFGRIPVRVDGEEPAPMTVLALDRLRRRRVPRIALAALGIGRFTSIAGVEVWEGIESLELTAGPPVAAQADGESLGMVDGAVVEWLPDALLVVGSPQGL